MGSQSKLPSLFPYQQSHLHNILKILDKYNFYWDPSCTGTGKGVVCCHVAHQRSLKLAVICPKSVKMVWRGMELKYGIKVEFIMSYSEVRGKKNKYLEQVDTDLFFTTIPFDLLLREDILLVFDEVHFLKNLSALKTQAALSLVQKLYLSNSKSKVAFLSATPGDQLKHSSSFLHLMGVIQSSNILYWSREISEFYRHHQPEEFGKNPTTPEKKYSKNILKPLWRGFKDYILPFVMSKMFFPQHLLPRRDFKNGFYMFDRVSLSKLSKAEVFLRTILRYNPVNHTITTTQSGPNFCLLTKALMMIEESKIVTLIRLATETLSQNGKAKVILFVWYKQSMQTLYQQLSQSFPSAIMNDETSDMNRTLIVSKFQQPNCNLRLLITSPAVGGVGLNLDDEDGGFPRTIYAIPSYHLSQSIQACGRIARLNTKSLATVRWVYCVQLQEEQMILRAITRKSKITKKMRKLSGEAETQQIDLLLPNDFENEVEIEVNNDVGQTKRIKRKANEIEDENFKERGKPNKKKLKSL